MSVLIIGMEMPKSCISCELYEADWFWCRAAKKEYYETIENKAHPDWCPLVPVPPHGDLIDRDDFFATCPELVDGYKRITDDLVVIPAEEG